MFRQVFYFIAFLLTLKLASAVTLNDFTPRVSGLTGACEAIYTADIDGCTGDDFAQKAGCSTSCISALIAVSQKVNAACHSQARGSSNIITAFLDDSGVSKLCPNAVQDAAQYSTSIPIGSSTMILTTVPSINTQLMTDTSSEMTSIVISTATIQPLPDTSSSTDEAVFTGLTSTITGTSLAFATTTPSSVIEATMHPTLSSRSTQAAQHTQKETSSGGSPFDTSAAHRDSSASYLALLSGVLAILCLY
ncbi:hypothetical protein E4T47_08278 [Aureobasidium subglaciale]|nr:hypothetical protein E4T43_07174 [Aureobasidium subglaciale]KAI5266524.1 hypothetical protein E4T47_08278 [Aureobasidium subglaciale]